MAPRIGFIGIIGDQITADPEGTLRWVADLGFDGMEGAASLAERFGVSVPEARAKLESFGLSASVQGRIGIDQDDAAIRAVIDQAKQIGSRYVVDYYAPFNDRDQILRYCDFYNRVGALCAEEGITFLYHNHDHEMRRHGNERGLDIFLAHTDAALVKIELDVAWVTFGGADPVAIMHENPERYPVLHMKDFERLHPGSPNAAGVREEAVFAEVGDGVVNTAGVVTAAKQLGVDWLNIEQDRMNRLDAKASLERSFRNLKALVG